MTDERLLADFLTHRDESAFEVLIRRYGPMVFRVCRDVLGDYEHAEDAFQATFLVLVRKAGSIRQGAALGRWLYEVALRISRRERRRLAKLRSQERQALAMDAAAPPDFDPADGELKPILHEEIGRLPSKIREAIVLCYLQGLTVDDAARRIGCPVGTLKSRLGKGREMLRSRLTRRGLAASVLLLLLFSLTEEASAALPDTLLDATIKAGSHQSGGVGVSRRIASMVLQEEDRSRWVRMTGSWSLLITLVMILWVSRVALGRRAEIAPPASLATSSASLSAAPSSPLASPPAPVTMPGAAQLPHCQAQ
jgi:polysaccharide export outer membrane protein